MANYEKTWGIYPWSIERGEEHIFSKDLELIKSFFPLGKVFYCSSVNDNFIDINYGNNKFKVKPELYQKVDDSGYFIGDIVQIKTGSSEGKEAVVKEMNWHFKNKEVVYLLEVDGKMKSRRYLKDDFELSNRG